MSFCRTARNRYILLLFSLGLSPQFCLGFSQEIDHCSEATSELPRGLLASPPQAIESEGYRNALTELKGGQFKQASEDLKPLGFAAARNALGVALEALDDCNGALEAFQQAHNLLPDSPEIIYNLANLMMRIGRPNAAVFWLQSLLNRHRNDAAMTFALKLLLADASLSTANNELAVQTLESLQREKPNVIQLHLMLATAYTALGSLDASAEQYREALGLEPPNCTALMGLSKTLLQMGNTSEAVAPLKEYVRHRPQDAEGYYVLGRAYRDVGQFAQAAAMFSKAVQFRPEDYDTRYQFAMALWGTEDRHAALRQLDAAERLKPDQVQVHSARARIYSELGEKEQAEKESESAKRLISHQRDLEQASSYMGRGNVFLQHGDLNNAETQFRQALQLDPHSARARSNLGLVLGLLHHPQDAQREFQEAIALDPKLATAHNALGVSYAEDRRVSEAKTEFERAIQVDPQYAEAKNNLGALYAKSGNNPEAIALFEQATEDAPKYPQSYLNWGLVLANQGNLVSAKSMFERALQLSPNLAQARKALQIAEADTRAQN
jgi:Flp pilus assembly protein TadD